MQVTVHLRADASDGFDLSKAKDRTVKLILGTAKELGVEVRQLKPAGRTPAAAALRRNLFVTVPDEATAKRVIARFKALPVTDTAYIKPDAVPPSPQ